MPRRFERHKRGADGYYEAQPSRSEETRRAARDPGTARRAPAKKDTRRWCRGKPGAEHVTEVSLRSYYCQQACGWVSIGHWIYTGPPIPKGTPVPKSRRWKHQKWQTTEYRWRCLHRVRCKNCGKVLGKPEKCPDKTPKPEVVPAG